MTLDSRTCIVEQDIAVFPQYSSSETGGDISVWIQLPISHQAIDPVRSAIIDGIYVQTQHPEIALAIEPDLAWELEAWEAASDEALMLFEAKCD